MSKTLVNIITDNNPISAYLFIKEMYEEGDSILYISAKDTRDDLKLLSEIDGVSLNDVDEVVLKEDIDEFRYEKICQAVKNHLKRNVLYYVNLAGGTRYMALAIQQVFENFSSEFYYVNIEDNTIVKSKFDNNITNGDDIVIPIKHRMTVEEYLRIHDIDSNLSSFPHKPVRSYEYALQMFSLFKENQLDHAVLNILRTQYSDVKNIQIADIKNPQKMSLQMGNSIARFLDTINFKLDKEGYLNHKEIQYLIGGWLEEYMYYKIQSIVRPQDIVVGTVITRKDNGMHHDNELDVVFTKGNKLFVVECKTGVDSEKKFNEIVYKASSLKEALLGVSCYTYIASLKQDKTGELKRIAQYMGLEFWDREIMTNDSKFSQSIQKLEKIAQN